LATTAEHSEIVLSGILPNRKDLLEKAMRMLTPDHFPDRLHARLFQVLSAYYDKVNSIIPRKNLDDFFRGKLDEGQLVLMLEAYDAFTEMPTGDPEFHWSVEQLREHLADKRTSEVISTAMESLKKDGNAAARDVLLEGISVIDRELSQSEAPEGLIQDERIEILEEYAEAKAKHTEGKIQGIGFGIANVDAVTGGMQPGDLAIIAASSSNGKSAVAVQSTWYASVVQGANTVFFATETSRVQIRRRLIARHSKQPQFDYPEGLNSRNIKEGTLTEREEKILKAVVQDLEVNPNYGKIHLAQVPRGANILDLERALIRLHKNWGINHTTMDYLALLSSVSQFNEERSKYTEILREAKLIANSAADGAGVSFLSPWQINREGRKSADSSGYYNMDQLADTSEATKIADLIVSMYRSEDQIGRFATLEFQVLKARDSELAANLLVDADYATSSFIAKEGLSMQRAQTESDFSGSNMSLGSLYS
jgi:replicative DNA helicase